jgi:ferrous iron transport protein A
MHHRPCPLRHKAIMPPSFPLALAGEGERVQIVRFCSGTAMQERLLSMGINLHDEILVIQKQNGGATLIEKSGARYALGGGMAHKINVIRC